MEKEILLAQLGSKIRELRKTNKLTQVELAHAIGKDQQSIQRLEAGKVNPSYICLYEIAVGLGINMRDITDIS